MSIRKFEHAVYIIWQSHCDNFIYMILATIEINFFKTSWQTSLSMYFYWIHTYVVQCIFQNINIYTLIHLYTAIKYVNCFWIYIHSVFHEIIQFKKFLLKLSVLAESKYILEMQNYWRSSPTIGNIFIKQRTGIV